MNFIPYLLKDNTNRPDNSIIYEQGTNFYTRDGKLWRLLAYGTVPNPNLYAFTIPRRDTTMQPNEYVYVIGSYTNPATVPYPQCRYISSNGNDWSTNGIFGTTGSIVTYTGQPWSLGVWYYDANTGFYFNVTNYPYLISEWGVPHYSSIDDALNNIPQDDPYAPGGTSEPGGGTGDFDGTSDEIPIPGLPTLSATSTGFITLFNPSAAQLKALADYMWSNSLFDIATWKKIFADPMDAILGLSIVPVAVPSAGSGAVSIGNISTDVYMPVAATQYIEVDCGTLNVNEYWGAYLDYDPYTKAEIYLPYIGTHALSVDDIMGKAVHVVYHIDILSGACAAFVQCGDSVIYTFIGQCAASIPISGNDWTNVINGAITAAASIGSMVATGGASAPIAVPALASTAANSMKPNVEKSGSMSGAGGMLSIQSPYLILTRPRQALPFYQNGLMGYPSFMTETLGDLTGYTEVEHIHLENVPCTENEAEEILEYLHGGVII